jgi:flagellin-like hook-associated protein FlgL
LGVESEVSLSNINNVPMSYLNQALENISYLRSQAAGTSSRLKFINDVDYKTKSFSSEAYGRMSNVDYASQSAFLAKQKIMTSVSAAMIAQANTVGDVALIMLN